MSVYAQPIPAADGLPLAGGWVRFTHARVLRRDGPSEIVEAERLPPDLLERLTAARPPLGRLSTDRPRLMGVLNVTPDSFSDGGQFDDVDAAVAHVRAMAPADLIDVGAESTRPGARTLTSDEEAGRLMPVLDALRDVRVSVDTRKSAIAQTAINAGAAMINDVSGGTFDPDMFATVASSDAALCLMHGPFDPATMQEAPNYMNVVLDVYDFVKERLNAARAASIPSNRLMIDPGIGFGKTQAHNLALIRALPLFHGLGVPILLGVSRKKFIGTIGDAPQADQRMPGTLALTLHAVAQGVQWHRVHDVAQIAQGLALWQAAQVGGDE